MEPFMYLPQERRDRFKRYIDVFVKTYMDRIAPVFERIEEESEEKAEEHFAELGQWFDPERSDPADYAERAREFGFEYWEGMSLMQYNTRLMSIATLYQFWEQQFRRFAFEELTRHHSFVDKKGRKVEFKTFCTQIDEIKEMLLQCGVNTTSLDSWAKIDELRLLQNVIKHGDGKSAADLEKIRPDLFRKVGETKIMDLYLTILNERALDVEDKEIITYGEALQRFWDELPERMYWKP
jgi:hypothetical protein